MTIQLTTACFVSGSLAAAGSQHTLDEATEAHFIYQGLATRVGAAPSQGGAVNNAVLSTDSNNNTVLVGADGVKMRPGGDLLGTPVVLYEGDSITDRAEGSMSFSSVSSANENIGYNVNSYVTWEQAELGLVYDYVNSAVSGETIELITARLLATDISSYAVVSLLAGTNNISAAADVLGDIALIETVCQYCLDQRKPLRILTIPTKATAAMTADNKAYILAYNTALKKLPQKYPNVFVGDTFRSIQDQTAADPTPIASAIEADNVHPSKLGAYRMAHYGAADAMDAALRYAGYGSRIDSKAIYDDGDYTEVLTNTDFITQTGGTDSTGGGILTGTVPDGWRLLLSATPTAIVSAFPFYVPEAKRQRGIWATGMVVEEGDATTDTGAAYIALENHTAGTFATDLAAGKWQRVWSTEYCWQLTVTADAAADGIIIQREAEISAIAGDDVVQGFCGLAVEGEVDKVYGGASQRQFAITATTVSTNKTLFNMGMYSSVTDITVGERFEGMFRTVKTAFQTDAPADLKDRHFKVQMLLNAAGSASIIIYKPSLRVYA